MKNRWMKNKIFILILSGAWVCTETWNYAAKLCLDWGEKKKNHQEKPTQKSATKQLMFMADALFV